MSKNEIAGPTPIQHSEPLVMGIMGRGLEEVVYKPMPYPTKPEEQAEFHSKQVLRRMPTKHCGILELHGVQGLFGIPGALEMAVEAAAASGYSDTSNYEEAVGRSDWGPSGYLIASLNDPQPEWEKAMEKAGFTKIASFFNTIWDKTGDGRAKLCSLWGQYLNQKAKTGQGNWRKEPFYVERARRLAEKTKKIA